VELDTPRGHILGLIENASLCRDRACRDCVDENAWRPLQGRDKDNDIANQVQHKLYTMILTTRSYNGMELKLYTLGILFGNEETQHKCSSPYTSPNSWGRQKRKSNLSGSHSNMMMKYKSIGWVVEVL
jgi:hypothetical protein